MSRIGKNPITITEGVIITVEDGGKFGHKVVKVKGPKGELSEDIRKGIDIELSESELKVINKKDEDKYNRSLHGLYRTLINNMVEGVTEGFQKKLEIVGIGYKAIPKGEDLELYVGFSHPILVKAPEGIALSVEENVKITVSGINKRLVGEIAARIRKVKKPEPYKGKGIRYEGEVVKRKVGKAAATTEAT
ncbi:50S ribosomal protein L6 [Candidatus Dojkabacteria bacterium]|nr:50S ribosomal protein L6 [Candidatus Dojkabacteria bacterium]